MKPGALARSPRSTWLVEVHGSAVVWRVAVQTAGTASEPSAMKKISVIVAFSVGENPRNFVSVMLLQPAAHAVRLGRPSAPVALHIELEQASPENVTAIGSTRLLGPLGSARSSRNSRPAGGVDEVVEAIGINVMPQLAVTSSV